MTGKNAPAVAAFELWVQFAFGAFCVIVAICLDW